MAHAAENDGNLPARIEDLAHLEDLLSHPNQVAIDAMRRLQGDVVLLGVGGKMGPSLARMIVRASQAAAVTRNVFAVSRFSQQGLRETLQASGIETIACDLLDEGSFAHLPEAQNVVFMTGAKFGTSSNPSITWAMNTYCPALVCRRYSHSRLLAFSTGNVYPFVRVDSGGALESDRPNPVGEYGMSALGRERVFEYFCERHRSPLTILRLNYAVEMRYGVLADLARKVHDGTEIDLSMGYANVIWQGDANAMTIASLADADCPPFVVNVAGPELLDVRKTCERFGEILGRRVSFVGEPAPTALLSNGAKGSQKYGKPRVGLDTLIEWTADWIRRGGVSLNKPTHFESRDGQF